MSKCGILAMGAALAVLLLLWGCSPYAGIGLQQQIRIADRRLEWGLVYFNSWLQQGEPRYLNLARGNTATAVVDYFEIQLALGHAWPQFYDLDKRRRRGCRFLQEIDRAALRNRVELADTDREGCLP